MADERTEQPMMAGTPADQAPAKTGMERALEPGIQSKGTGAHSSVQAGLVAIQAGKVVVHLPSPDSPRPSITPGANVLVTVNGDPIYQTTAVGPEDEVVVKAISDPPEVEVWIEVARDGMQAVAHVYRRAGAEYVIPDAPFAPQVTIVARRAGALPPPPLTMDAVQKALADAGVVYGVDAAAIAALMARPELELSGVVATGRLPSDPVDAHARLVPPKTKEVAELRQQEAQRIDLLDRGEILSVNEGDVVAEWVDARPGTNGIDVRGNAVPAPKPRSRELKLGSGARRLEGGPYIVATRMGRPVVKETFVDVVPTYDVPGDVSVATGHVDFAGDVTVRRNVEESLRVRAGGSIFIGGMVCPKARVEAGGSVRARSVVGGSISAGENAASYAPIIHALRRLAPLLHPAIDNLRRVVEASKSGGREVQLGVYFKALLERHFSEAQKVAQEFGGLLAKHKDAIDPELLSRLVMPVRLLVGRGPLLVKSFDELEKLLSGIDSLLTELESKLADSDVTVEYLQNAEVACGGKVRLTGKACYNSKVIARLGFEAPYATVRGGSITVTQGNAIAREIGSASAVVTEVVVAEDGMIKAEVVHPNVRCAVGRRRYRFDTVRRRVALRLDPQTGELTF